MSGANTLPLVVRKAKDDVEEYEIIGNLHAAAFANNPVYDALFSKMKPSVALQWLWIDNAKQWAAKGVDTVLVLERREGSDLVGLARFNKYDEAFKPQLWDDSEVMYPEGFDREENMRMALPLLHWQQKLMEEYGKFLFLQDFVIAPTHQRRGYGKWFLERIIEIAKAEGMNIALTSGPEQSGFWEKLGFQDVGDPITYGKDGSSEVICKMLLEQFKPGSQISEQACR